MDAGDQLILVERLCHIIVGTEAQTLHLVFNAGKAGENEDGGVDLGDTQSFENLIAGHVGQVQIEQDDVVIIKLAQIDTFLAQVGAIYVEAFGLQHELNALGRCHIIFDQKHTHALSP